MATSEKTAAVGSVWELDASDRAVVTRPDGETVTVASSEDGVARYVLTSAGTYRAALPDGKTAKVRAK